MRRLILEEPHSEAAVWSLRLAVFAIVLAGIGAVLIRSAVVEVTAGLTVFGTAILLSCIALLLAGAAMTVIWRTGRRGISYVAFSVFLALILLAYPSWLAYTAMRLPLINDITTDVNDPPLFSSNETAVKARSGRAPSEMTEARRLDQQRAYGDIQPIVIDVDVKEGYVIVREAVRSLGWRIIEEATPVTKEDILAPPARPAPPPVVLRRGAAAVPVPPQRPAPPKPREPRDGRIDAVDKSLIMGFPDDITIRIRSLPDQTRIDIRSASRYGRHDFGANAARIKKFARELQAQLDADQ